jgi:hypothetical protein
LAASRRTLGDEHPGTLSSIGNLGLLRKAKGDLAGAEALNEESLAARRRTLGDEHPSTLISVWTYATLRSEVGEYAEAEALLAEASAGFERVLGEDHPHSVDCRSWLMDARAKLKEMSAAAEGVPSVDGEDGDGSAAPGVQSSEQPSEGVPPLQQPQSTADAQTNDDGAAA